MSLKIEEIQYFKILRNRQKNQKYDHFYIKTF